MEDSVTVATVARVFNVVGFAGSLRRGSYNRALLRAATELAPSALHIVIARSAKNASKSLRSALPILVSFSRFPLSGHLSVDY